MDLTKELITAFASSYSIEQLQTMKQDALQALLNNQERIISASTGAGASYSKAQNYSPKDLLELISYALETKQNNGELPSGGTTFKPIVFFPENH